MKKVVIGMSGGVDSSVAAFILKSEGFDVIGVTMQIWDYDLDAEPSGGCCGLSEIEDARAVCEKLDIPHYVLNFRDIFREKIVDYFAREYLAGKTPNPCIACNRFIKWEALMQKARTIGADYFATGHYCEIDIHPRTGRYTLRRSSNPKDQTYVLYDLDQSQLARTLLPLGYFQKNEVREIAADLGLLVADKPDSQEICFIPDSNHGRFLADYIGKPLTPGNFVDVDGNVLGQHGGVANFTIGQRKGLGMAFGRPMFVKEIHADSGIVVLSDEDAIFVRQLVIDDVNFMAFKRIEGEMKCFGKIRYAHKPAACVIRQENDRVHCIFEAPQRAITPGQAAVFYDEDGYLICGGTIV